MRTSLDFYDYKTTEGGAGGEQFTRTAFNLGYDIQESFYRRGLRHLLGGSSGDCGRLVVQEVAPPYALAVYEFAPAAFVLAETQVDRAIAIWARCLETGSWPGYPRRLQYLDAPAWQEKRMLERESAEVAA